MGKKQLFLMSVLLVLGLTGCGDKVKPVSLSDDSAIKAQSEAVIEQSKAVVEESKALEKAKGNNDTVEETESKKAASSGKISHPFLILEYEGEKFDMVNDTMKDLVHFNQKMGGYSDLNLSGKIESYGVASNHMGIDSSKYYSVFVYNPYEKEIALKDTKIDTMRFQDDTPDSFKFLNGKVNFNSTFEEWMEAFKTEAVWDEGVFDKARNNAHEKGEKYTGPYPPEDEYANVLDYWKNSDNTYWIGYKFKLDDGRKVSIDVSGNEGKLESLDFTFDPYYE